MVLGANLEASSPPLLASTTCIIILNTNHSNLVLSFDVWSNSYMDSSKSSDSKRTIRARLGMTSKDNSIVQEWIQLQTVL